LTVNEIEFVDPCRVVTRETDDRSQKMRVDPVDERDVVDQFAELLFTPGVAPLVCGYDILLVRRSEQLRNFSERWA